MRELPEPEGQLAWQTYTRDQVLAIQKQAYEDGLRDAIPDGYVLAPIEPTLEMQWAGNDYSEQTANKPKGMWWWGRVYQAMLTASQKDQK